MLAIARVAQLKSFPWILLLAIMAVDSRGQSLTVQGNVSAGAGRPVTSALLSYTSKSDTTRKFAGLTDASGNYRLVLVTSVAPREDLTPTFFLDQNYPNPFRSSTAIRYTLVESANIDITIYNIIGQLIKRFIVLNEAAGVHGVKWDGTDNHDHKAPPGVYFCKVSTGTTNQVTKMLYGFGAYDEADLSAPVPQGSSAPLGRMERTRLLASLSASDEFTVCIWNTDSTWPRIATTEIRGVAISSDTIMNYDVEAYAGYKDLFGRISKSESPLRLDGATRIPQEKTLVIDPGVKVLLRSKDVHEMIRDDLDWSDSTIGIGFLRIDGKLLAEGTKADSICFTSDQDKDSCYWGCIHFSETADSNSRMSHCRVEHASSIYGIQSRVDADGITCWFAKVAIENCLIQYNQTFGIRLQNSETRVQNCVIKHCIVGIDTWAFDELAYLQPIIRNNVIVENSFHGISIYKPMAIVENNVVCYNGTAGLYLGFEVLGKSKIVNDIFYGNLNLQINIEPTYVSQPDITYSDIEGGWTGDGNIDQGPRFVDPANGDFRLQPGSACRHAGSPLQEFNNPDGSRNDMGAFGGPKGDW